MRTRSWSLILTAQATAGAILIAGCGGSSHPGHASSKTSPYGPRSSPYALSKCMRANGLSHFPDPSQGGFPGGVVVSIEGDLTVNGITFSGPALKRASRACKIYLPGGAGPPPTLSAQQRRQILRLARCMRAHGVPQFRDPTFGPPPAGNGGTKQVPLPGSGTPAFNHAIGVCAKSGGQSFRVGSNVQGP